MSSLDDHRFSWIHEPAPGQPYRIRPMLIDRPGHACVSYRRCITLRLWCVEQFGPDQVIVDQQTIAFATEAQMVVFVAMWSGISIRPCGIDDLGW